MITGRGRAKIRPPRRGINGDELDFESTWNTISVAFREIHTKNSSKLSYEELYRHAYRIVLKKKGAELYERVRAFEENWLSQDVRGRIQTLLVGGLITESQSAIGGTFANERRVAGERFLSGLKQAWEDHQLCMSMLSDVLMYMDRVYCADHRQPTVSTVSMALFRDHILRSAANSDPGSPNVLSVLTHVILDQIRMERDGDIIDKHLIKACVHMLEGLYETLNEDENSKLYITSFEWDFLESSREFYRAEAESLLRESDAGAYCRHTSRRIAEEQDRCRSTLSEITTSKIEQVVEDELIKNKIKDLVDMESGVAFMIDNDRLEELGYVFNLNSRVDSKKGELTRGIQKRIVEMGTEINNSAIAAAQAPAQVPTETGTERGKAPVEKNINQQTVAAIKWVEDVLVLKDKFDKIWRTAFEQDQALQSATTKSFADFINSSTFPRSSEYISLFIDENMKKGIKGKTENEIDIVLDKAIILLRYVQDKDLFERYYKKHLCRRLLMNKSISNDVEKQMISRMKIELGNNFTLKLEAMFKDMAISEELTSGYKDHVNRLGDPDPKRVDLSISVLTSMTWPLESMGSSGDGEEGARLKCIFPTSVELVKKGFETYYGKKHSGRTLTWLPNMGTADIKAVFSKVPTKEGVRERRHELNVSTYAMIILMLFNDAPTDKSFTFEEIQAQTNIPVNDLIRNLQSLAVAPKTRILVKEPMSKDIKPGDRFSFNDSFVGKFHKIKVGVVTSGNKVEGDRERKDTEKKNNDSRAFSIEAAIVRIMKQRKELLHSQLVTETISQLAGRFKPEVPMIKKRIESLIEREYLERVENASPPAYRYLA